MTKSGVFTVLLLLSSNPNYKATAQESIPVPNNIVVYAIRTPEAQIYTRSPTGESAILPYTNIQYKLNGLVPLSTKTLGEKQETKKLPTKGGYLDVTFSISAGTNGQILEILTRKFQKQKSITLPEVSVETQKFYKNIKHGEALIFAAGEYTIIFYLPTQILEAQSQKQNTSKVEQAA